MVRKKRVKGVLREFEGFHFAFIRAISLKEILSLPLNIFKNKFLVLTTIDCDSAGEWLERYTERELLRLNIRYKRLLDVCLIYPESLDAFLKEDYFVGGDAFYITSKEPSDDQLKRIKGGGCGDFSWGISECVLKTMKLIEAEAYFSDGYTGISIACKDRCLIEEIVQKLREEWNIDLEEDSKKES
ncbi:TPA: hypothetical protein DCX15_03375 [bacterium]|nr:hypothetical protein [bacterium]